MNLIELLQKYPFYAEHIYGAMKMYIDTDMFLSGSPAYLQMRAIKDAALKDAEVSSLATKA